MIIFFMRSTKSKGIIILKPEKDADHFTECNERVSRYCEFDIKNKWYLKLVINHGG